MSVSNWKLSMDNKIAFISGFTFTTAYSMTLYELVMALMLGIIGGFGGMIGKWLYNQIKDMF